MKPLAFFRTCLFAVGVISVSLHAAERPNILWITSEDNGPELGAYGDDYAISPNIDGLASKGMRYLNAISTAPVCAPARTTIISGIYPPATGSQHMRSRAKLPDGFKMFPQYLREAGYYCANNSKEDYNLIKPGQVWDESSRNAHWKNRAADQPFFAVFNHTISHESQIRNNIPEENQIHDPADAPIPAYHPDTPESRKDWAQYYDRITMMDARVGSNLEELEAAGLADDTIIFYYGDHGSGMPRSKRWTYDSGLNVPLIVYFPPKWRHLAPANYSTGGRSDRPVGFVDLAPTVLSLAGVPIPDWMQGQAFAGPSQTPDPDYAFGFRGRMDERYDMVRAVRGRRYIYMRNYNPHRIYGQYVAYMFATPTTRVWRELYDAGKLNEAQSAFWQTKPAEELYDLESDPDEIHNLVDSEAHQSVLERMRRAQRQWAREIRDLGFLPEHEIARRSGNGAPYDIRQEPDVYPFETIFAAAELATSLRPKDIASVAALMEHDDPAVRYWGAVGLLAHGETGVLYGQAYLRRALRDPSPIVRVASAEALGRFGAEPDIQASLAVLQNLADPQRNPTTIAVPALNAIDYMDENARAAMKTIQAMPTDYDNSGPYRSNGSVRNLKQKILTDLD